MGSIKQICARSKWLQSLLPAPKILAPSMIGRDPEIETKPQETANQIGPMPRGTSPADPPHSLKVARVKISHQPRPHAKTGRQ